MKKLFLLILITTFLAGCIGQKTQIPKIVKPLVHKSLFNKSMVLDVPVTNEIPASWTMDDTNGLVGFNLYYSFNPASLTNLSLFTNAIDIENLTNSIVTNEDDEIGYTNYSISYQFNYTLDFTVSPPYFCIITGQYATNAPINLFDGVPILEADGTNDSGIPYVESAFSNLAHWPVNPIGYNYTWNPARTNETISFYSSTNIVIPLSQWHFETNLFGNNSVYFPVITNGNKFFIGATTNNPPLRLNWNPVY